ncbi:MAG: hypothetical protein WC647_15640 [Desulfomonilaceae bacterium]|jgi:hypothetical protein
MRRKNEQKLVHQGKYVAEVDVDLVYTDDGWEPYLTVDDAKRLDEVREALARGDLDRASRYGRVYILTPVTSQTDVPDHVTP